MQKDVEPRELLSIPDFEPWFVLLKRLARRSFAPFSTRSLLSGLSMPPIPNGGGPID